MNAASSPSVFNDVVRQYFDLPDPSWPTFWRSWILSQGKGTLPLYHIRPEHLTETMRNQYDALNLAVQEGESTQSRLLAQQGPDDDDDDDDDDDEPEPIAATNVDSKELVAVQ